MTTPPISGFILRNIHIGNICRQWAFLEYQIALAIWSLLHIDNDTGIIVTGSLNMSPRITMALNLARHLKAPQQAIDALQAVHKKIEALEHRRNRAVHGLRWVDPTNPDLEDVEMHRGNMKGRSPQTTEELRQVGLDILAAGKEIHRELSAAGVFDSPLFRPARIIAR